MKPALRAPGAAWLALAVLLAAGSVCGWWLPANVIDWQPELAGRQPWRSWTSVLVHWSPQHLLANLAGTAVVAGLGHVGRLPLRATVAWFFAWPLTQVGLLLQPALAHYGGLSGVLHAGVAVGTLWLAVTRNGRQRAVALAILCGLLVKVLLEEPWGAPLRHSSAWDIAIAPLAHATGTLAGLVCASLALLVPRRQSRQ